MAEQKITLRMTAPEGYELTGEYRPVYDNELYLDQFGHVLRWDLGSVSDGSYFVVREVPKRPEWLPPAYIPDGAHVWKHRGNHLWYMSKNRPLSAPGGWDPFGCLARCVPLSELAALHHETFNPPPVDYIHVKREK